MLFRSKPCFPNQVHAISPTEVKEKVTPPVEVSFTGYSNRITYDQNAVMHDIRMNLEENSHKIKYLRESLNASVDSVKMIIKHCVMMNNQVEQMVSLQNKLCEKLISKEKQVCGVNTRGGSATQDPDYPEGHPKRKEQDALKAKKTSAGKSPNDNENEESGNSEEQENEISLSDDRKSVV